MSSNKFQNGYYNNQKKNLIVLDIVGLEVDHIKKNLLPTIKMLSKLGDVGYLKPSFPSVTCSVQSSVLTGKQPNEHGIISNGIYDKTNMQIAFWEQSNNLVQSDRIFDILKKKNNNINLANSTSSQYTSNSSCSSCSHPPTTALLFWQNSMYANSDYIITPRPLHLENGQMEMWCYSKPPGYYEKVSNTIGKFDLMSYWGPFASIKSSQWIENCIEYVIENDNPDLLLAYLPQIDYSAQKFGKNSEQVKKDLKDIDNIVENIVNKVKENGQMENTDFIIFSEYSFNDVDGDVPINKILRMNGLLVTRSINGKEYIDFEYSKAFAMVDHQIAHIFINNKDDKKRVKEVLCIEEGIDAVLDDYEKKLLHCDNKRSGDLIAISKRNRWFSYYWWLEEDKAPSFTKTVDIHRKPGYDPLELFMDFNKQSISFDTKLIKGSHGRPFNLTTGEGLSCFITTKKLDNVFNNSETYNNHRIIDCTDIFSIILNHFS